MNSLLGLEELLPVQKSRACVWSSAGTLEVLPSQMVSFSSVAMQKPPHCLTFAEVYPHKNKRQNFCLSLWQFKIKSSKIFSHLFFLSQWKERLTISSANINFHFAACRVFAWLAVRAIIVWRTEKWNPWKQNSMGSLQTPVSSHMCLQDTVPQWLSRSLWCVCVAVGFTYEQCGYPWGAHNWRDIIYISTLFGIFSLARKGTFLGRWCKVSEVLTPW